MLKFYDSNSLFATPDLTFSNGPLVILENSSKTFYLDLGFCVSLFFFIGGFSLILCLKNFHISVSLKKEKLIKETMPNSLRNKRYRRAFRRFEALLQQPDLTTTR